MNIELIPLLILSFAAFRITRFLLFDSLIDGLRRRWYVWLVNRKRVKIVWQKIAELTSCSWCLGTHVSWILLALYVQTWPWALGVKGWITAFGIMGAQGLLHVFEPDD